MSIQTFGPLACGGGPIGLATVVVHGGDAVNPPGTRMWRFSKVRITVGEPIDFSRYRELRGYQAVVRAATDELMAVLCDQSGQEYVDVYGADVKSGDAA